ncbi:response regulator, partial [Myxococcota bacterium]|nr:response regulator [Myxococcota bacterium]
YFSAPGEDIGFEGILRDITERKSLEEQLIRAERMAAVGTLAGGVAHEFNNINLAVLGYSELGMFRKDLPDDVKNYFKTIRRSALRAKSITSNLLTFSGGKTGSIGSGNLTEVVSETLIMLDHEVASKGIKIVRELKDVPNTMMDSTQIGQVILNMLINAHHSMIESVDKTIIIETGVEGSWVFVRITDRGCGIPPEHLTQIFSPFFSTKGEHSRGTDAQSSVKGTGLGLSISHTIVSNHKGAIDVTSKVDEGTSFTVRLPIIAVRTKRDSAPAMMGIAAGNEATILILDDEPDLRQLLDTFMKTLGHTVITTGDGQEGLDIISQRKVDVVIVDLQMPKMTGTVFMDRLYAMTGGNTPVVIVMTGKVMTDDKGEFDKKRVFRVIRKPFKLNEISSHVSDALLERMGAG